MIPSTEDTRYAFVNGIIRAREAKFLTRSHFDRLIAGDLRSFSTILADTEYVSQKEFPEGLENAEMKIKNFFDRYCLTEEVKKFLDWPEQMHNLKVQLKGGGEELLYAQRSSEVEHWPEVIDAVARYTTDKDPFILSTSLDRILCKYIYQTARFAVFFQEYYKLYFDLENIISFFRSRQFENSREIFNNVYIPYGSIDKNIFLNNLNTEYEQVGRSFFTTPYQSIAEKGEAFIAEKGSFLRLERLCEEIRLQFLLQTRRMAFGVEPLFGYYQFKLTEIKKLRQVYWGKLNQIPAENIKESIPDVW